MNIEYVVFITGLIHLKTIFINLIPIIQFLFHTCLKYNTYEIDSEENKQKIMKNIKNYYCYSYDGNKDPLYFMFDKRWIPKFFIYNSSSDNELVTVFCNEEQIDFFLKDDVKSIECLDKLCDNSDVSEDNEEITYFGYSGLIGHSYISERKIDLHKIHHLEWYEYQEQLYKDIFDFYKKNSYCKVFLSGKPGIGKTFFGYMLAQRLNCYLTDQFNPTQPGYSLSTLYHRARKICASKPLIIILDEVDVMIDKVHKELIPPHKHYKTEITDKITWNQFLDRISYGLFPNVIILMISNKNKLEMNKIDSSYLRNGRVDVSQEW